MLMTLPPFGPKCASASRMTSSGPSTFVSNSRWNSSSVTPPAAPSALCHADRRDRFTGGP